MSDENLNISYSPSSKKERKYDIKCGKHNQIDVLFLGMGLYCSFVEA